MAWYWILPVALLLLWQWRYLHRRYATLAHPKSVRRVLWASDGWMVEDDQGMQGPWRLCGGSRVMRDLMVLHFRRGGLLPWGLWGHSLRVPVLRDNVLGPGGDPDPEGGEARFHLLQIFLRWQRPEVLNPGNAEPE